MAADAACLAAQQAVHLLELRVHALQLGGLAREHVGADVVANRHLVADPPELRLHDHEALEQAVAARDEIGVLRTHGTTIVSGRLRCCWT